MTARFAIGIDLGTTHSALSYIDLDASSGETPAQGMLPVPQLVAPGQLQQPALLPSFLYLAHEAEFAANELALPWPAADSSAATQVVGELARSRGAGTPMRLVSSAKSWLCHPGVDRRAAILPADAPPEVAKISPLQASCAYLRHLRQAWDLAHPDTPFAEQDITITIPASFDPAARELTLEAAQAADYPALTLLEEPQAALYHWICASGGNWRKQVKPGEIILVIDVGGGTSDFSLIAVTEQDGQLQLQRIAVGEHILLGGDNMDLTLAHVVAQELAGKSPGTKLDAWQMRGLTHACRSAKEQLLSDPSITSVPLVVPSRGSKLIGGTIRCELTRTHLMQTILEGFFPQVTVDQLPQQRARSALSQLGLPYAQDAAITRHLAALLTRQAASSNDLPGFAQQTGGFLRPDAVLFNGGVFKSSLLRERTLATLNQWLTADGALPARELDGADFDLAVAGGAAYYGYVRRGGGVRIRGGTARSFYIGIESSMPAIPGFTPPLQALCVAPFGMEEGSRLDLPDQAFTLVVGEAALFRFFASSVRRHDVIGSLLDDFSDDELQELNELSATLDGPPGSRAQVRLQAAISEAGTLELLALALDGRSWKVQFDVRGHQ